VGSVAACDRAGADYSSDSDSSRLFVSGTAFHSSARRSISDLGTEITRLTNLRNRSNDARSSICFSCAMSGQSFFIGQKILYVTEDFGTEKFRRIEPFIVTTHFGCNISAGFSGFSFVGGSEINTPINSLSSIAVEALLRSIQYLKTSCAPNQSLVGHARDIEKVRPSIFPLLPVSAGKLSNSLHCSSTNAPAFPTSENVNAAGTSFKHWTCIKMPIKKLASHYKKNICPD
jgi:hypothetical protein